MAGRRRKKRITPWIIIPVILVVVAVGIIVFIKYAFSITTINITGSDRYTYDEMYRYIFADRNDKNMLLFKYTDGKAADYDIPFVSKVNVDMKWPHTLDITVYEKTMIGYIAYKGSNMYFDKDGIIVESSTDVTEGIPLVTGLEYNSVVLYNKLDVENEGVFTSLQNLSQYLSKYGITVDEIVINSDNSLELRMDKVHILLGQDDNDMGEKIFEVNCMLEQIKGRDGVLDMSEWRGDDSYIIFKENES